MNLRVIPQTLTPTASELEEAQHGLSQFSGHWPSREVALSVMGKKVAQVVLKDLKVDGVKVIGFDVGDHRHLLLLVSWGGFGFEGSVGYRSRQVLVKFDASKFETATNGAFNASAGLDVQAEAAAFAKLMAAALEEAKAPAANEWAGYAKERAFLLQLRGAPAFVTAKAALDLVPAGAAEEDPSVLRAVFALRLCLLPLSKEQRDLAVRALAPSTSHRQNVLLSAVFERCDQPTWSVRVMRDAGVEEEQLTFTATGFRRRGRYDGEAASAEQRAHPPVPRARIEAVVAAQLQVMLVVHGGEVEPLQDRVPLPAGAPNRNTCRARRAGTTATPRTRAPRRLPSARASRWAGPRRRRRTACRRRARNEATSTARARRQRA
jgi:hypothetical protein